MIRVMLGFIVFQLLACQARQQPRAPREGGKSVDAGRETKSPVADEASVSNEGQMSPSPIAVPDASGEDFFPEDCLAWKTSDPSLPSGVYSIFPQKGALGEMQASCDMETDGGGWTLILNYNHKGGTNPELNVRFDSLPILGSDMLGMDESMTPESWGHAGNELLRSFTGFREVLFHCRSSENTRVLHFKTGDASCVSAMQLGNGSCGNIRNEFVPMSDHSAILPAAADRFEMDRLDETLTYNTFGKTESDTPDRMWSIRAEPSQQAWECDYGANTAMFHTLHRVWIR